MGSNIAAASWSAAVPAALGQDSDYATPSKAVERIALQDAAAIFDPIKYISCCNSHLKILATCQQQELTPSPIRKTS